MRDKDKSDDLDEQNDIDYILDLMMDFNLSGHDTLEDLLQALEEDLKNDPLEEDPLGLS